MSIMNEILAKIVLAVGGTVTNPNIRNELLRDWLKAISVQGAVLTVGNLNDEYGYLRTQGVGNLVPSDWIDGIDTVEDLIVDDSSNAVIFRSTNSSKWSDSDSITLSIQGTPDVILNWNGSFYVAIDAVTTAYLVNQVGNDLSVTIKV